MNPFLKLKRDAVFLIITASLLMNSYTKVQEPTAQPLSFAQQFQLDFIRQELHKYPELFINDWTTSSSVQLIVESAELAVQNSSEQTKPAMKQRIIELFQQIHIAIQFTDDDLINKIDPLSKKIQFDFKDTPRHNRIKKRRAPKKQNNEMKLPKLQKIKGARRTLRRIKKKLADQEKAAKEAELAEIRRNASIRSNPRQHIDKPHETINSRNFWRNRLELRQEHQQSRHTQNEPIEERGEQ